MNISNTSYHIPEARQALTGGAAAALALKQINPDVMAVYPITPQTPIIEGYAKYHADGEVDTEIIQVESEHSAMSACVGASAAGARVVTATSSQGLSLMNEMLYIASGTRLPILMLVSARALSAPLNIHGDHSDVMGARDTGWVQLFSETVQEVYDNTIIGMKLAEKIKLPVMVIMDGFFTSHSVENLELLEDAKVKKFAGNYTPEQYLLDIENPVTFGPVALPNSYFDFKIDQEKATQDALKEYKKIIKAYGKISGREGGYVEKYKLDDAEDAIVVLGSIAGTVKDAVDALRAQGRKVGLLKINLFRPFPRDEVRKVLRPIKKIAVLDKAFSFGTHPPLYSEIAATIRKKNIASYVCGLGGRDVFKKDIEKVFDSLREEKITVETRYIIF